MDQLAEIIVEIRRMNHNMEKLIERMEKTATKEWMKIPEAANHFDIAPNKLRSLCKKGLVPAIITSDNPDNTHYLINTQEAKQALLTCGFYERKETRGRKPKMMLTK